MITRTPGMRAWNWGRRGTSQRIDSVETVRRRSAARRCMGLDAGDRVRQRAHRGLDLFVQPLPCRCQRNATAVAQEQGHAEAAFKALHTTADAALRNAQGLCRGGEAAHLRDGEGMEFGHGREQQSHGKSPKGIPLGHRLELHCRLLRAETLLRLVTVA